MQPETEPAKVRKALRQNRFVRITAIIGGILVTCCCGLFAFFFYQTTTPEFKASATARAIAAATQEADEATAAAVAEATQRVVSLTRSAEETATAEQAATANATLLETKVVLEVTEAAAATQTQAAQPTATPRPTETPQPTPTLPPTATRPPELKVEIFSHTDYIERTQLVIYGEVINSGDLPAEEPEIRATVYNAEGGILAVETTYVELPLAISLWFTGVLYPGEKAPFKIFIDEPGDWSDYKLELMYEEAPPKNFDEHYRDLRVFNDTGREINNPFYNYRVSGEIENTGNRNCGPVRFVVTLYGAEGEVVGAESLMEDVDPFAPGQSYAFSIELYARRPVASYAIMVRAIKQ